MNSILTEPLRGFTVKTWWTKAGYFAHIEQQGTYYCGYVLIPPKHSYWGRKEKNAPLLLTLLFDITYFGHRHKPNEWWIGFDSESIPDLISECEQLAKHINKMDTRHWLIRFLEKLSPTRLWKRIIL